MSPVQQRLRLKVYLEDTDAQGIVYHANYLKFCERGRTELLGSGGRQLGELQEQGWIFVVHEMHLRFKKPAKLHDELEVVSEARRSSAFRVTFDQEVYRVGEDVPLFTADVQVVAVGADGGLRELPNGLFVDP